MNDSEPKVMQNQARLFPLGQIVATPGALEALESSLQTPAEFLTRHARGDWGDLSADDIAEPGVGVLCNAYDQPCNLAGITSATRAVLHKVGKAPAALPVGGAQITGLLP